MTAADIVAGLLIGGVLGVINLLVLRAGVRFAFKCSRRVMATLVILASYAIRYTLIAVTVIYFLLRKNNMPVIIIALGVLGVFTIIWALVQRARCPTGTRGP